MQLIYCCCIENDFIEYGTFQSPGPAPIQYWPLSQSTGSNISNESSSVLPPTKRLTVRQQSNDRRKAKDEVAQKAILLAEGNVSEAMCYVQKCLPYDFLHRSEKLVESLNHLEARKSSQKNAMFLSFCL